MTDLAIPAPIPLPSGTSPEPPGDAILLTRRGAADLLPPGLSGRAKTLTAVGALGFLLLIVFGVIFYQQPNQAHDCFRELREQQQHFDTQRQQDERRTDRIVDAINALQSDTTASRRATEEVLQELRRLRPAKADAGAAAPRENP